MTDSDKTPAALPNYWTTKDLAEAAGVDQSRIRQLLLSGDISGIKMANTWFIPDDEARRFLASRGHR